MSKRNGKVIYTTETITPAQALKYLENAAVNRPMNGNRVMRYASAMAADEWIADTGETVKFNEAGQLIDGQKRMAAVMHACVPVTFTIARGVPQEAMDVIDTAQPRSASNALAIAGYEYYTHLAAACRVVIGMNMKPKRVIAGGGANAIRPAQAVHLLEHNSRMVDSIHYVMTGPCARLGPDVTGPGICGGWHYLMAAKSKSDADEFFAKLATGVKLSETDPILKLRNRLIADRRSKTNRLRTEHRSRLILEAWNARRGRSRKWLAKLPEKVLKTEPKIK